MLLVVDVTGLKPTCDIFGVEPFVACDWGVPSRTTWFMDCWLRARMMSGPTMNDSSSAVTAAPTARKEMY